MFKRIQTQIIVLVTFVAVFLILAVTINWFNETARWNVLYTERYKDNSILLENVIQVKGDNLRSFAYDYSYWDEMLSYLTTRNKDWADINVIEPISHFNIQAAWILNIDFSCIFSFNSIDLNNFNYPISKEKLKTVISKNVFSHFFFKTPKGLMEVRSAPIQPSDDTDRKTKPAGYFLVGRLWNESFIKEIESITSTEIYLLNNTGQVNINNIKKYSVVNSYLFYGWDNKPVGKLISIDEPKYIKEALTSSKIAFRNHVIFAYLLLVTISYSLVKLVNSPLKILSKSLSLNSSLIIEPLLKEKNEFGRFAKLIKDFFEQKSKLVSEITERKKVEENLRKNEERLKLVLEGSNEGFWDLNLKNGKVEINEEWFYTLDYKRNEIPHYIKHWVKLVHPDDLPKVTEIFFKHLHNEAPMFEIEHRLLNNSGEWIWILNRGRVVSWEKDCKPIRVAGTITDITFKKNTEELIKQNERKYGFFVGNVKDVIFQTDKDGSLIFINPAWYNLTGYNPGESLGKKLIDFIHDDDRERNIGFFDSVLKGRLQECGFETRYLSKDLNFRWVEVLLSSVKENDNITGLTGTLHDVTRRKFAEEEILQALQRERELNELKSKFVSMVSHEYRTPLASILSSAELVKLFLNDMPEDEKNKHISNIINNVDNMNEMLNDVLYINQADAGKVQFQPEKFELVNYCRVLIDQVKTLYAGKNEILFDANYPVKEIFADKRLLNHILVNILTNSIKYSNEDSLINFKLQFDEKQVIFKTSNYGIGIPLEDQNKIFNPFFRAGNVSTINGTGLGLSIAKICADLHNGELSFESNPGGETTFYFKLPV